MNNAHLKGKSHDICRAPAIDPGRDYWIEAQKLAQNHLVLLNRIERSLSSSDASRLRAVRGQIFLQTSAVDRFLKSSYPVPEVLCASNPTNSGDGSVAGTDAVSLEEAQVYCALISAELRQRFRLHYW